MSLDDETQKIGITVEQIKLDEGQFGNDPDPDSLLLLPTRNVVLFPNVTISINLKRDFSLAAVNRAAELKQPVGVVCQIDESQDKPSVMRGLYKFGVIADVLKVFELPDGSRNALVRGRDPFTITGVGRKTGHPKGVLVARATLLNDVMPAKNDRKFDTIIKSIRKILQKLMPALGESGLGHMLANILSDDSPEMLVNIAATNLPLETADKEVMLAKRNLKDRAAELLGKLTLKEEEMDLTRDIMDRVRQEMNDDQKRAFLQHQMDAIYEELYGGVDEASELAAKAENMNLPQHVRAAFDREIGKLRRLSPQNPDYYVTFSYLDMLLSLPWNEEDMPNFDFHRAKECLDADHCGLDKVKERVLEQIASIIHNPEGKSPILCLVGPPGVGKTSLGQSIANAMDLEYQRVSLGGLHDEAEIRGHRRTYIGAMPGRIIDAIKRAGVSNPVLVLDEVDKIGADYKGDPASALLEVLDPEQNKRFHDNYIDVDFDLSKVLFIATANTLSTIPKPLIDRMEVIALSGYMAEEKLDIARKHLLRRIEASMKIEGEGFAVSDAAINAIIDNYTSESGVRQLEKNLSSLARKFVLAKVSGKEFPAVVEPEHLKDLLGLAPYMREKYEGNQYAGVVTGLAWTEAGGEILLAEASLVAGKGKETVTGNLGDVMKESASIAYQWVKAHAQLIGINAELFEKYNLHIHFPEGAIPKDGPSAGITIATAIVSAFMQRRVRERMAMTGEITLRGKVLPVGGIKEKILAAKRAGITDIVLSVENQKDIDDIDPKYVEGLRFHFMETALEVMRFAITDEPAADAMW